MCNKHKGLKSSIHKKTLTNQFKKNAKNPTEKLAEDIKFTETHMPINLCRDA